MSLWDRQPTDTDLSWVWFVAYRDAVPPRALGRLRVAGQITPPLATLLQWLNEGCWRDRAAAWDQHLDALRQAEREALVGQDARETTARHMRMLQEAEELANRTLDKMLRTDLATEAETLKAGEFIKLMETVIKYGRLVRGETTENVGTDKDFSKFTLDELKQYEALLEKSRKK